MQTADVARDLQFNMRVSREELDRLEALAEHYGINTAAVLRMLIKRDADALGVAGNVKPKGRR